MAHIKKVPTNQRRNGKPVYHYEVRWTEPMRDEYGVPVPLNPARPDGPKQMRHRQETCHSKEQAETRCDEINAERRTPAGVRDRSAGDQVLGVFVLAFLDSVAGTVKARTLQENRRLWECYVRQPFGSKAVAAITPADVRRYRADLLARGLARSTIKHAFDTLRRVLDLAIVDGAIASNPCAAVPLPRRTAQGYQEEFKPHPLTAEQVAAVANHIAEVPGFPVYGLLVNFAAYTGLRAAELAGLEIGDLQFSTRLGRITGTVKVTRTKRKIKGGWEVGTPKSRKSKRTVPLDDWLAADLHKYLTEAHPNATNAAAPLFPGRYSRAEHLPPGATRASYKWDTPVNTGTFYDNYLKPALRAVNLPAMQSTPADSEAGVPAVRGVRLHDLRHTFAVLSLSAGEHYMQVSKWLGHESYVTTLNVYGDWIPQEEGGKRNPLARPTAPIAEVAAPATDVSNNVVPFRRQPAGYRACAGPMVVPRIPLRGPHGD